MLAALINQSTACSQTLNITWDRSTSGGQFIGQAPDGRLHRFQYDATVGEFGQGTWKGHEDEE